MLDENEKLLLIRLFHLYKIFESFALHGLSNRPPSHRRLNQVAIISEIVFCREGQKTQAILYVLTSIFGLFGGKIAAENCDID